MEFREHFFTPAYYLFNWNYKLRKRNKELAENKGKSVSEETKTEVEKSEPPSQPMTEIVEVIEIVQLDLFENL